MKQKKPRTWVKTFMPIMAPKVEARTKTQTVRPWPKRTKDVPQAEHRISCREWTGRPYNSKQRELCEGEIAEVLHVRIRLGSLAFYQIARCANGKLRLLRDRFITEFKPQLAFAQADGFETLSDFHEWFLKCRLTEFRGVFIKWTPDP